MRSLGDEDKRKAFDRGEIDAEGKPRFQGFDGGGSRAGGRAAASARRREFRELQFRPGGLHPLDRRGRAAAAASAASRTSCEEAFGGAAAAAAPDRTFEPEDFGVGADVQAEMTVSLPDAANGATQRAASAERQGRRRRKFPPESPTASISGSRARAWPGPGGAGDVLITV